MIYCECHCVLLLIKSYKWPVYEIISTSFCFCWSNSGYRHKHDRKLTVFTLRTLLLPRSCFVRQTKSPGVGDQRIEHMHGFRVKFTSNILFQGGGTHICCVLQSSSAVKMKVKGQLEIFFEVNCQATISL